MARFEVTIRYKGRKKKNWVKVIEADPEFIVDLYNDEASITIKRVEDKTDGMSEVRE